MRFVRRTRSSMLSVADQSISSLGSLLLAASVARVSTPKAFGSFVLLYSIYWLMTAGLRASLGETLLIRRPELSPADSRLAEGGVLGIALIVSGVAGAGMLLLDPLHGSTLVVVWACAFPCTAAQDSLRYIAVARGRRPVTLVLDGLWLVLFVALGVAFSSSSDPEGRAWILAWVVGAGTSSVVGAVILRPTPFPRATRWFTMNCRDLSFRGLCEFVINSGSNQVVAFAIPLIAGLASLAAVRAGQVAAGPLNVLWTSASVVLLPWFSKLSRNTEIREIPARWLWSSVFAFSLLGLLAALLLAALPDKVGEAVLGASWSQGSSLAPLFCAQTGVNGSSLVLAFALRASGWSRKSLYRSLWLAPVNVLVPIAGALLAGAKGTAWGMLVASVLALAVWVSTVTSLLLGRVPVPDAKLECAGVR